MMGRSMDLIHSFLLLVSIATFWSVVYAQSDTNESCKTCPVECIGRRCARYWWTSMWGFIITLVALTMDVWGVAKPFNGSTLQTIPTTIFMSALNPLYILWSMLRSTITGMAMLANLREALGDDVVAPLYPWSKSHIKIILGCSVIVNLSEGAYQDIVNMDVIEDQVRVQELSEALVIGTKVSNPTQVNVELSRIGQLALLRSNVLPPYDELKFLRGNSSLGMAIASAQAIGYIYGVVVRCAQGLPVSPIEAIACVLNIVILMKGILHNFTCLGHRPLLLHLLPEEELKFIIECRKSEHIDSKMKGRLYLATSIACGILLGVGAYFIVNFKRSLNRPCLHSFIVFELSLISGGTIGFCWISNYVMDRRHLFFIGIVFNTFIAYIAALVVTFKYWKREQFDVQSSNYLSQLLPYIG